MAVIRYRSQLAVLLLMTLLLTASGGHVRGHQRRQGGKMARPHHASDPCRLDLTRRLAHISNALHKKRCRNADYDPVDDDMGPQPTARK